MKPAEGEVWILRDGQRPEFHFESVVLVLDGVKEHPGGDVMFLGVTLETNNKQVRLLEWWHHSWFTDEASERLT